MNNYRNNQRICHVVPCFTSRLPRNSPFNARTIFIQHKTQYVRRLKMQK